MLRGDIVKNDSGSSRFFHGARFVSITNIGHKKLMDVIPRQPDCAGPAADAVSAYTQERMDDAPKLLKIPMSECPAVWIRLPDFRILGREKVLNWECLLVHRQQSLFLSENVDDIKLAGRKQSLNPVWKKWMKLVDLGERT